MRKLVDKNKEILYQHVHCGPWGGGEMLSAMSPTAVLFLLSVLSDLSPTRATNTSSHCEALEVEWRKENLTEESHLERFMTVNGTSYKIQLRGGGAARAAHELLHVLLRRLLRYTDSSVEHITAEEGLCALAKAEKHITVTVSAALAWRLEQCQGAGENVLPSLGAPGVSVLGAGVAPVARRLFLHAAAKEFYACRDPPDWTIIANQSCGYLSPSEAQSLPSNWPNCSCTPPALCVRVFVVRHEGEDETSLVQMLESLCKRAAALPAGPAIQLVSYNQTALRDKLKQNINSFLYIDYHYDNLFGDRHAPWLPCTQSDCPVALENAVSLFVASTKILASNAPRVSSLLGHFKPSVAFLQNISRNALRMRWEEAACKVAIENLNDIRLWLKPEPNVERVNITLYSCSDHMPALIIAYSYWESLSNRTFNLVCIKLKNSSVDAAANDIETASRYWTWGRVGGVVVMAEEGAGTLPEQTRHLKVPVMLVQARGAAPAGVRAVLPSAKPLVHALRWLLQRCNWQRFAVLREEGRSDIWKLVKNKKEPERIHEQVLDATQPGDALAALEAKDARVIVVDASAAATERVLRTALERKLTPANGYAWIVFGSAGNDWIPPKNFAYVTVSSWWRGGQDPGQDSGSPELRKKLNVTFKPQTASFVDAILLMMTGISKYLEANPEYFYDLHAPDFTNSMFELLDNTTIRGVAQTYGPGATQFVFVHRWTASGSSLVATWPERKGASEYPDLCEAVKDAPFCHTVAFGPDSFSPQCHDVAIAVALCVIALIPPALCVAAAARRARVRRRERILEELLLARTNRSAATAALAAHAVPRASLEILDELGVGHYGSVRLAILRAPGRVPLAVAAKSPRKDAAAEAEEELLREAALLATLKHEHIVRFAGVCFEGVPLVLMENAFHGDLCRYLRAHRPLAERARAGLAEPEAERVAAPELTRLAREAAAALSYLKDCRLIHRDVRAANCLVDVRCSLKLADFGMARRLDEAGKQGTEYLTRRRAMFPVLWMAPESLARGVFSAASDVWGLGVLLLELAALGARPYGAWPAPRVLSHVLAGGAPPLPRDAAPSTRGLLAACWCRAPEDRPSAASLVDYLARHPRVVQPALAQCENHDGTEPEPATPEDKIHFSEWT